LIAACSSVLARNPTVVGAYSNRGENYRRKGDYDRAIADLDHAIRLDPNFISAYYNRGTIYVSKGDFDRAITDFDRAIRLAPQLVPAYTTAATPTMKSANTIGRSPTSTRRSG
jgi:tetratricopeptide (TPR) repeat protein